MLHVAFHSSNVSLSQPRPGDSNGGNVDQGRSNSQPIAADQGHNSSQLGVVSQGRRSSDLRAVDHGRNSSKCVYGTPTTPTVPSLAQLEKDLPSKFFKEPSAVLEPLRHMAHQLLDQSVVAVDVMQVSFLLTLLGELLQHMHAAIKEDEGSVSSPAYAARCATSLLLLLAIPDVQAQLGGKQHVQHLILAILQAQRGFGLLYEQQPHQQPQHSSGPYNNSLTTSVPAGLSLADLGVLLEGVFTKRVVADISRLLELMASKAGLSQVSDLQAQFSPLLNDMQEAVDGTSKAGLTLDPVVAVRWATFLLLMLALPEVQAQLRDAQQLILAVIKAQHVFVLECERREQQKQQPNATGQGQHHAEGECVCM